MRVVVSAVNPTDWKSRRGAKPGDALPFAEVVPNQDGAGIVDAVGTGVDRFEVGDRVWPAMAAYQWAGGGTAQEVAVLPVERVFALPEVSGSTSVRAWAFLPSPRAAGAVEICAAVWWVRRSFRDTVRVPKP